MGNHTGYREQAAPSEADLWHVVQDGTADPLQRVAAAVALTSSLDGEGKKRLKRVAGASAVPKVRVALDLVVEEEDEALEGVLMALNEQAP